MGDDQPYSVVSTALSELVKVDPAAAASAAQKLENEENASIKAALLEIYATTGDRSKMPFFQSQLAKVDGPATFTFFDSYPQFLRKIGDAGAKSAFFMECHKIALDGGQSQWRRFGSTKAIADERNDLAEKGMTAEAAAMNSWLDEIKKSEKDEMLLMYYQMF